MMMNKLVSLAAGAALLALTGTAYAEQAKQPIALSDKQMDRVTAGSTALANAVGLALGEVSAATITQTSTEVDDIQSIVLSQAYNLSVAAGGFLFNAAALSHSDTYASLDCPC
jgi:hypothetical protein